MRSFVIKTVVLGSICLGSVTALMGAVSCRESPQAEGGARIEVENQFFRIAVEPDVGGKIASWFDKIAQVELVHWGNGDGGLLDDRGERRKAKYEAVILEQTEQIAVVRLSCRAADDLEVVKTLTFRDASPVVAVHYHYKNHSQGNLFGFAVGVRNFFVPGGGTTVTEDDHYYVPTTHAIRRFKGFTMKPVEGDSFPEFGTKLKTAVARPWAAFVDTVSKQGLALSLEDDFYVGWYAWKGGAATPTFEWMYGDLPAGYQRETELNLIQINGLTGAACATPDLVVDMRGELDAAGKGTLKTEFLALTDDWTGCMIETEVRQVGSDWKRRLPMQKLEVLPRNQVVSLASDLVLPGKGLFEVHQSVVRGDKMRISWDDALTVGPVETEPIFSMEYRAAREMRAIPGWKADEPTAVVSDDASLQRGYGLFALSGQDEGRDIAQWTCHLARDEYDSFPLLFHPFRPFGRVGVKVKGGEALGARVRVEVVTSFDSRSYGVGISYSHLLYDYADFVGDKPVKLWLTLGNGDLKPGTHTCKVTLEPETGKGEPKTVTIQVVVHDVALPHRPIISLEAEGSPMSFPRCGIGLRDKRDGAVMDAWFQNMTTHGIDFFQEIGGIESGRMDAYLRLLGSETTLAQDIKARPDFYEQGDNLPELDFSLMDFYFDRALASGLVRFKMAHYDLSPKTPGVVWRYQQTARYLRSKGFAAQDMFVKIMDEQPANRFPEMSATAKWLKEECGFRPFSTFSNLFSHPEYLKILNPYFDMYQGGFTSREDWEARIREGLIDPSDEVCTYTGWGTMCQPYEIQVAHGWNAVFHGHHMFHNHEYMRGGNARKLANIVLIGDDDLPIDSPSFEGLRDGMECANLVALYREWREQLRDEPGAAKLFEGLDRALERIMAELDQALVSFTNVETPDGRVRRIQPVTLTAAREAHVALLELLDQVAPLAKASGGRLATATWDGLVFQGPGQALVCKGTTAGVAAEAAVADDFVAALTDALGGIKPAASGTKTTTVAFRLVTDPVAMPYTYQIVRNGVADVEIRGSSEANLKLGGRNLIQAMRIAGVWR